MRRRLTRLAAALAVGLAITFAGFAVGNGGARREASARRAASARLTSALPTAVLASLTPGACLRFSPTRGNRRVTVFVDPGHGGLDVGALGTTSGGRALEEKGLTLAIGLDLLAFLRQQGDAVVMSRVTDTLVARLAPGDTVGAKVLSAAGLQADLRARVACANASGAQVLLGIHLNAFSDPSVGGAEAIYGAGRPFSARSRRLATAVETGVVHALATNGWAVTARAVVSDAGQGARGLTAQSRAYGHLVELGPSDPGLFARPSRMPGTIAEPLFLTNPAEAGIAASPRGQRAIARGLAAGVQRWLLNDRAARKGRR